MVCDPLTSYLMALETPLPSWFLSFFAQIASTEPIRLLRSVGRGLISATEALLFQGSFGRVFWRFFWGVVLVLNGFKSCF